VVGASGKHRTFQATNLDYPAFNTISRNYSGNVGVWSKQTAAYYKSVARENIVEFNVFHDGPRSGVNYNDGAMGGEVLQGNMLLNYVKESNDHGPFNSEYSTAQSETLVSLCLGLCVTTYPLTGLIPTSQQVIW
jgi:hypothetical protein